MKLKASRTGTATSKDGLTSQPWLEFVRPYAVAGVGTVYVRGFLNTDTEKPLLVGTEVELPDALVASMKFKV